MKKIFLGGPAACGIHFEKDMIKLYLSNHKLAELTKDYTEADIIVVIDTCMSTYDSIIGSLSYINELYCNKKSEAKVIVSGCLTRNINFELPGKCKDFLNKLTLIPSNKIIEYVMNELKYELNETILEDFELPYSIKNNSVATSIVSGCLNNCSFCKKNFIDFNLESIPFHRIEKMSSEIDKLNSDGYPIYSLAIQSSNLSLYGVDLYREQKCHDAISTLTKSESIKFTQLGAIINWYPELINEIINNPKIKTVFTSLESGSERIYNLMNRPISLNKLVETIKTIKKYRPDIIIDTEFICGYPTETIEDLKKTIELVQELDVNPLFIHPYHNSLQLPSSSLPQHSFNYNTECFYYANEKVQKLKSNQAERIKNGDMVVIDKYDHCNAYAVLLINGGVTNIRFDQLDREYNIGDIIPGGSLINKQLARKREKNKKAY